MVAEGAEQMHQMGHDGLGSVIHAIGTLIGNQVRGTVTVRGGGVLRSMGRGDQALGTAFGVDGPGQRRAGALWFPGVEYAKTVAGGSRLRLRVAADRNAGGQGKA